jgi:hypothetical protein
MSLALKSDRARQSLKYWQKMVGDPKLSPVAVRAARDRVRYYQGAVVWYEKAFAYQERNRQERIRQTLANSLLPIRPCKPQLNRRGYV